MSETASGSDRPSTGPTDEQPEIFRGAQSRDVIWAKADEDARRKRDRLRRRKNVRRFLLYHLFLGPLMTLAIWMPRWFRRSFLRFVLEPISFRATRKVSLSNLERVYGDELSPADRQRVARQVTRNFLSGLDENLEALRYGKERLLERIDDSQVRPVLDEMFEKSPRGFLGLTGHLGNWELLGSWLGAQSGRELAGVVAKRNTNPFLNARIERTRTTLGMPTYYREDPPGDIVKSLRRGKLVAIVPDQDVKSIGGLFVDFLGSKAYTPTGPARLALTADVPIVCGGLIRTGDGRFRIEFEEPIWPDRKAPREQEIERLTQAWSEVLERLIRRHPEQWAWFHERWKTTPEKLLERGRGQARIAEAQRPENSDS
ncbi:MAG: lysophospholipid acyltransferase family protein [Planctomycetota bacterium]